MRLATLSEPKAAITAPGICRSEAIAELIAGTAIAWILPKYSTPAMTPIFKVSKTLEAISPKRVMVSLFSLNVSLTLPTNSLNLVARPWM